MPINYLEKIQLGDFSEEGYRVNPSKVVESVVEGFYVFSRDQKQDTHLIFNDGFPVLVFLPEADDTVSVLAENKTFEIKGGWASAGAIKNVYIKYNASINQVYIVRFYPGSFYPLFGLDAHHFKHKPIVPFESIAKCSDFSMSSFFKCNTIEEKTAFLEEYIYTTFSAHCTPEALHQTLDYIHKIKGQSTVRNVTNDIGVNYKWLERSFAQHIGFMPKVYIQLQRFIHAYLELVRDEEVDLMRIALSNGYYDSNHFLKDFKGYTGKTPLEYLRFQTS
ncbi:helix-turn-helix domain-containing protein [Pedobacter sp. MC2016-24]|uniref:helix-turn-helix domain-containing protein n=1 Tax=Pedobacter sp. MC2016-24 TaxID=2780090 RepID=UPI00188223F8|nr:helix-turn-helix domain-containing protein [Pedobacter sp. MC2016-24]MBE9602011.1 AraC family transcriptional regulator [Pedobacter sp. MC2016-24]